MTILYYSVVGCTSISINVVHWNDLSCYNGKRIMAAPYIPLRLLRPTETWRRWRVIKDDIGIFQKNVSENCILGTAARLDPTEAFRTAFVDWHVLHILSGNDNWITVELEGGIRHLRVAREKITRWLSSQPGASNFIVVRFGDIGGNEQESCSSILKKQRSVNINSCSVCE